MRYFANPSTQKVRDAMTAGLLDCIQTPAQGNAPVEGAAWCADNGCFGKGFPGETAWFAWLLCNADRAGSCLFAVAPDVVGDAEATLERSDPWLEEVRAAGYPVALVAQNGATPDNIPWDRIDAVFLGGSAECLRCTWVRPADDRETVRCPGCHRRLMEWKLSAAARRVVTAAKAHGKWVHMGRVNSEKRLRYAALIGCDSADGTYISKGPDINLPKTLGWLARVNNSSQQALTAVEMFGGAA